LAFFAFSSSLCNEQATITERSHKVREIVMGFPIVEVRDAIRGSQRRVQMAGLGKREAHVSTLIHTNMRMVLQVRRQAFLKLSGKRLTNVARITSLKTGKKPGNGSPCYLENIQSWRAPPRRRCGRLRIHETPSLLNRTRKVTHTSQIHSSVYFVKAYHIFREMSNYSGKNGHVFRESTTPNLCVLEALIDSILGGESS
jgi:hypothetical protein